MLKFFSLTNKNVEKKLKKDYIDQWSSAPLSKFRFNLLSLFYLITLNIIQQNLVHFRNLFIGSFNHDICPTKTWRMKTWFLHFFWSASALTLFRMGLFGAAHGWGGVGWGGAKSSPLPKICHIYPTMMKLGAVIPYLMKIQNIYESRDTPLNSAEICDFHPKSANFATPRNTDIHCILVHNF